MRCALVRLPRAPIGPAPPVGAPWGAVAPPARQLGAASHRRPRHPRPGVQQRVHGRRAPCLHRGPAALPETGGALPAGAAHARRWAARERGRAPLLAEREGQREGWPRPTRAPAAARPPPAAGRLSFPAYLKGLSAVLHLEGRHAQALLDKHPFLGGIELAELQRRVDELAALMRLPGKQVAFMVTKQPRYLLLTPLEEVERSIQQLAASLGVQPGSVVRWSATTPSVLKRSSDILQARVARLAELWSTSERAALAIAQQEAQYLTDSLPSIQRRSTALRQILMLPRASLPRLLAKQPDALFMSPRIMNNKLKVLMAILGRDRVAAGLVIAKAPGLLRCNLTAARANYEALQALLGRQEGYVFAMMCHQPRLLLERGDALQQRALRLKGLAGACEPWQREWQQLRPPQTEECLARGASRLERLEYLVACGRQGAHGLEEALCMPSAAFAQQHPDFAHFRRSRAGKAAAAAAAAAGGSAGSSSSSSGAGAGRGRARAAAGAAAGGARSRGRRGSSGWRAPGAHSQGESRSSTSTSSRGRDALAAGEQLLRGGDGSSSSSSSSGHSAAARPDSHHSSWTASSSSRGQAEPEPQLHLAQQHLAHHLAQHLPLASHSLAASNGDSSSGSGSSSPPGTGSLPLYTEQGLASSNGNGSRGGSSNGNGSSSGNGSSRQLLPMQHPEALQEVAELLQPAASHNGNGSSPSAAVDLPEPRRLPGSSRARRRPVPAAAVVQERQQPQQPAVERELAAADC